jgi:hypothetical protein
VIIFSPETFINSCGKAENAKEPNMAQIISFFITYKITLLFFTLSSNRFQKTSLRHKAIILVTMTASRDVPTFLLAADFITFSEIKTLNFHTFGYKETHSATAKIKIKL